MKKMMMLPVLLALLGSQILSAQFTDRGNFMIGTTLGYSKADSKISLVSPDITEEERGHSATQFSIAPTVGYFLVDNFALGIGMDYTFSTVKEPDANRTTDSDMLFGPFTRVYFPIAGDMALFAEANAGFGNSRDEQLIDGSVQNINTNIFAIGVGPGFTIFSSQGVGIEALFKYNFARSEFQTNMDGVETTRTTETNQFDVSLGLQFYFGGVRRVGG